MGGGGGETHNNIEIRIVFARVRLTKSEFNKNDRCVEKVCFIYIYILLYHYTRTVNNKYTALSVFRNFGFDIIIIHVVRSRTYNKYIMCVVMRYVSFLRSKYVTIHFVLFLHVAYS